MHASSTPRMVDQRPAAAALAAIFLTVGLAVGAAIGITIAPTTSVAVPGAGATGISPADSSAALQQHVLRENAAAQSTVSSQLQQHLLREYFAAEAPGAAENNMSDAVNKALNGAAIDAGSLRGALGPRVFDKTYPGLAPGVQPTDDMAKFNGIGLSGTTPSVITTYRDERGPWRDEGLLTGPTIGAATPDANLFRGDRGYGRVGLAVPGDQDVWAGDRGYGRTDVRPAVDRHWHARGGRGLTPAEKPDVDRGALAKGKSVTVGHPDHLRVQPR